MATDTTSAVACTTDSCTTISNDLIGKVSYSKPYPPVDRDGIVDEHDKPFFYYGHLGIYHKFKVIVLSNILILSVFLLIRSCINS